ncbi:MAG: hypothetical protein V7K98_27370 [Nostoc sp.]|uniref:hypothetical protein n=1 Tax=Nostoc sp. TaxID=1180 RepID=UPI002FF50C99
MIIYYFSSKTLKKRSLDIYPNNPILAIAPMLSCSKNREPLLLAIAAACRQPS